MVFRPFLPSLARSRGPPINSTLNGNTLHKQRKPSCAVERAGKSRERRWDSGTTACRKLRFRAGTRGKTSDGDAYAVLIGDVLQSTRFPDQKALFNGLRQQFEWVNERVAAVQPLGFTVGDEFQAAYSDVVSAFRAVLLLRLKFRTMKPAIDQVLFRMDRTDVEITLAMLTGRKQVEIATMRGLSQPGAQPGRCTG